MSSRDSLDEILDKFLSKVYADSVEDGVMKAVVKREVFQELEQSLHQWALDEVIGADEPLPVDDREWDNVQNRNKLRAEQRLKLKGDIDEQS